jgi:glycosyltransferase involved in cell wall biosynthesis
VVGGRLVNAPPTIWVLVHDLGRSGVPVVLARLLVATPAAGGSVHVVARRGGELEGALRRAAASVTTLEPLTGRSVPDALALGLQQLGVPGGRAVRSTSWRRRVRALPPPDVVLLHGAGAWGLLDAVPGDPPVVVHLHELHTGLDRSIPRAAQADLLRRAARVLAVSRPVAELATSRGARPSSVDLVPGVVEVDGVPAAGSGAGRPVMGAGQVGWRKGTDRLAAIAFELERSGRRDHVGWVGGRPSGADVSYRGAVDPVRWWPSLADPWALMADASVVVVPSREDPLPLVALEAGLRGRAVVAMATGGLPELLSEGRGWSVEGQDVVELTRRVLRVLDEPDEASSAGRALAQHVRSHHDAAVVAPRWWELLTTV